MTEDTVATTANLEISKKSNNKSNSLYNRYRRGSGYSMVFGHSDDPEPETTSTASKNTQTLRTANQQAQHYTLDWSPVNNANGYVVMRYDDKGDSPTKAFINRVDRTHRTLNTHYNYQLLSGTYHFEIYACYRAGHTNKTYEHCGGESDKQTVTGVVISVPDTSIQPQNVAYSDPDSVVASGEAFNITWENPATTNELTGFNIYGELSGYIGFRSYDPAGGYSFTRNSGAYLEPKLQAGRQYCYKVVPRYVDSNNNVTEGEAGRPSSPHCITVGDGTVIQALKKFTTVKQIPKPEPIRTVGVNLSWYYNDWNGTIEVIPEEVAFYQLDRETSPGSGDWYPIYYGPEKQKTLFLEEINVSSSYSFRVSACDIEGNCGNYRRLYFYDNGFKAEDIKEHTSPAACIHVDPAINSGAALNIQWCKSGTTETPIYQVVNGAGTVVFNSSTSSYTMTDNGLMKIQVNNISSLSSKYDKCYSVVTKYVGDTNDYSTEKLCTKIRPNTPTNFVASTGGEYLGGVLLDWDDMPDTYNYQVFEASCNNGCSTPQDSDWTQIADIDSSQESEYYATISTTDKYFYRVSACGEDPSVCSNYTPTLSFDIPALQVPTQPSIALTEPATRTVQLDWTAVSGASEYQIEWADCGSDCSALTEVQWQAINTSNTNQLLIPNMTGGKHAFSVRACHVICSDRSAAATLELILPEAPTNVVASVINLSTRQYLLRWSSTEDAVSYTIQWALCNNGCDNVTANDWQTLSSATDSQLPFTTLAGEIYTLKVAACNSTGLCSDYSSPANMPNGVRTIRYIHSDNLGSPVAETDENGNEQ